MLRLRIPFVRNISGMAQYSGELICFADCDRGTLNYFSIMHPENTGILNYASPEEFKNAKALIIQQDTISYAIANEIKTVKIHEGKATILKSTKIDDLINISGIVFCKKLFFISDCNGQVIAIDTKGKRVRKWNINANLNSMTLFRDENKEYLFFLDAESRAVYAYDPNGNHLFSITLPHEGATSLTSFRSSTDKKDKLYISYVHRTWEVFDNTNPNSSHGNNLNLELDKQALNVFIEPLNYNVKNLGNGNSLCTSGGYRALFKYFTMLLPRSNIKKDISTLHPNARISVPVNTQRQKVLSIKVIGKAEGKAAKDETGEEIIEFNLENKHLDTERIIFGYQSELELYNIRYLIKHSPFPDSFPPDIKKHLNIDRKLDMHRMELKEIAVEIIQSIPEKERNSIVNVVKAIREYVYTKLEYKYNSRYTRPLQTLKDGEGTCGKYTELLLGLMRLCRVPCRAVGDYKIPDYKLEHGIINTVCRPDYDHVWIEFYVPDVGWVPMESSSDNLQGRHNRFFAALPWVHIENSRAKKRMDAVIPGTWQKADKRFYFSDYFVHETEITVEQQFSE